MSGWRVIIFSCFFKLISKRCYSVKTKGGIFGFYCSCISQVGFVSLKLNITVSNSVVFNPKEIIIYGTYII